MAGAPFKAIWPSEQDILTTQMLEGTDGRKCLPAGECHNDCGRAKRHVRQNYGYQRRIDFEIFLAARMCRRMSLMVMKKIE